MDEQARIRFVSPSVERILGYGRETVIGQNVFRFVHPDDRQQVMKLFAERIQSADYGPPAEIRVHHKSGAFRTMEVISNNLLDHPAVRGLVVNAMIFQNAKSPNSNFSAPTASWRHALPNARPN